MAALLCAGTIQWCWFNGCPGELTKSSRLLLRDPKMMGRSVAFSASAG